MSSESIGIHYLFSEFYGGRVALDVFIFVCLYQLYIPLSVSPLTVQT